MTASTYYSIHINIIVVYSLSVISSIKLHAYIIYPRIINIFNIYTWKYIDIRKLNIAQTESTGKKSFYVKNYLPIW